MPYTPPSQQSPSASGTHSPLQSRSHSSHGHSPLPSPVGRPDLPRSASYLQRHRRTPSVSKATVFEQTPARATSTSDLAVKPPATSDSTNRRAVVVNGSLHQSPHPMTDSDMPPGAVVSPPDSSQSSSDDESLDKRRRGRQIENLAELQAAIRIIEQNRGSSPSRMMEEARKAQVALDLAMPALKSALQAAGSPLPESVQYPTPPLSSTARKISHSRSATESAIITGASDNSGEDSDTEEQLLVKPPMIRKKSGELVKPALRPSFNGRRRPSSMPGTPTYGKAVHFDQHLEHVRHFLQVDRPLAVSAGSSPVESYESDTEFPFGDEFSKSKTPPFEWDITLSNFPRETFERRQLPVRVEKVFLSSDKKNLVGNVIVKNISFHKNVVTRFTLDYWKTTSEVTAEYSNDIRKRELADGHDRFTFNIRLADQANLDRKTLFFCVRYNVDGQEFWDNNDSINFQVDFKKQHLPQNGKNNLSTLGARPSNSLPRSRPNPPASTGRPRSMPLSFDDFAAGFDSRYNFGASRQPASQVIGESPAPALRLKQKQPVDASNSANLPFSNRYDFSASLSAPRSKAKSSEQKPDWKPNPTFFNNGVVESPTSATGQINAINAGGASGTPSGTSKPPLQSSSYNEFIDKYCFFGSSKSSPKMGTPVSKNVALGPVSQLDGSSDVKAESQASQSASVSSVTVPIPIPAARTTELRERSNQSSSPNLSRSSSPAPATGQAVGSGLGSPISFGYPFHHGTHSGFSFGDAQAPTAIRG